MYLAKKLKIVFLFLFISFFNVKDLSSLENKILFKVDNEIITTIDIHEEIKFLKTFSPETNSLSEEELYEISKNSIIRDKIKKIEIMNYVEEIKVEDKFLLNLIKNKYSRKGIDTLENFENYLKSNNLNTQIIREKLSIELIWNDIIYQKFNEKIIVDKVKIKKEILQAPQKEMQKELLLSEIVFDVENKADYENKYQEILQNIIKNGFKKTALIFSNSDTASNGGLIGWVKEDNLNKTIKEIVSKLKLGEFSKPIRTSSGFIIILVEDEKKSESKFNLDDKVEEIVRFKINNQLSQFSSMYLNKIKKDLTIYGL
ncbi:peptidylprolyl isomerase [Candidatus Pelagibacter sp.]|uniref:peptidylprolyl isomerase n=1 Tax=Candidatus Pelagibacter sp. TaxID=2024849 RepID=UPI003F86A5DB